MPSTLRLRADDPADLLRAASILREGGRVGFPTETVYGLGANALSARAVEGIFHAKARPAWDPLIVHLADTSRIETVADLNDPVLHDRVQRLAVAFWPGPLTLLLPRTTAVPDVVTAGRALVGVRVPAHPVAQALLHAIALPIAAPSANRFGHVSPTTAEHVLQDLDGRIEAVLEGGRCSIGLESTVVDPSGSEIVLYRSGAVTPEMLESTTGCAVHIYTPPAFASGSQPEALPSPGVGIRHYAPSVPLLLTGSDPRSLEIVVEQQLRSVDGPIGILAPLGWPLPNTPRVLQYPWGEWHHPETLAAQLFAGLRALEDQRVAVITAPLPEPGGVRDALRDRLLKAARPR